MRISVEVRSALPSALLLVVLAFVPALLAAWFHPKGPQATVSETDGRGLALEEALARAETQTVLWIDARSATAFAAGRLPEAINLREDAWEDQLPGFIEAWQPGRPVIVYCDGGGCAAAKSVAERLRREFAIDDVWYLEGGWDAWQRRTRP
jgi:rhodanese-related sulfurtransferase